MREENAQSKKLFNFFYTTNSKELLDVVEENNKNKPILAIGTKDIHGNRKSW